MFRCPFCHGTEWTNVLDSLTLIIEGKTITINNIPAKQCESCGETFHDAKAGRYIDEEVARQLGKTIK